MIATGAIVSAHRKPSASKPRCDWCSERFRQSRRDQRYCCPACRRRACERRRAETYRALCDYFAPGGVGVDVLRDFLELHLDTAKKLLIGLGLAYDERAHRWA